MRLDLAHQTFRDGAVGWLRSLDDAVIVDAAAVLHASPGYYPTTIMALRDLELRRRRLTGSMGGPPGRSASQGPLPVGHPADYDWRFTSESANQLLDRACKVAPCGGTILHLGTPGTFVAGAGNGAHHVHVLIDGNHAVVEALSAFAMGSSRTVMCIDLTRGSCPRVGARCAILDPPWYPDYTSVFLAAAADACLDGATILLCQPSGAARPGVAEERRELLERLPGLGLELGGRDAGCLRYEMPHFERMSLRRTLPNTVVPWDWRVGDLMVLRKVGPRRSADHPLVQVERWEEVRCGPVRVKLRGSRAAVEMEPLVPGDTLPTVSRRDEVRQRIGMWTSGNRVYGVIQSDRIRALIESCDTDRSHHRFAMDRTIVHADEFGIDEAAARRLYQALSSELSEHLAEDDR